MAGVSSSLVVGVLAMMALAVLAEAAPPVVVDDDAEALIAKLNPTVHKVRALTSNSFEHDTQASSGATTGDWFVLFHSERCVHCRSMKPAWEAVAKHFDSHHTSIASVDCDESGDVCRRFAVRSYPSMILFRKGQLLRYGAASRTEAAFLSFLRELPAAGAGSAWEPVPQPLTLLDEVRSAVTSISIDDFKVLYQQQPMLIIVTGVLGVLTFSASLAMLLCPPKAAPADARPQRRPAAPATAAAGTAPAAAKNASAKPIARGTAATSAADSKRK